MLQTVTDTQTDLANSCLVLHDISWENYEQLLEHFCGTIDFNTSLKSGNCKKICV
jgi:hypothetical protein